MLVQPEAVGDMGLLWLVSTDGEVVLRNIDISE